MKNNRNVLISLLFIFCCVDIQAQHEISRFEENGTHDLESGNIQSGTNHLTWGRDSTTREKGAEIPIGQFQWTIDPLLGRVIAAENNDTVVHNFQSFNLTEGYTGQYSFLGNLGAPRLNRIFMNREPMENFIFISPFSFFRGSLQDFRFTNTFSPITNLAYHKCGTKENGQDRIRAYFASNINKVSGIGFKVDYLYGRGYYNSQANSQFGGTFYGYYRGDKYNMHAYVNLNHMKMAENGGIEDERYIKDPQSFPQRFGTKDIPVNLTETWNRNHEENYYLTHRYNIGFDREIELPDSLKPKMPSDEELLLALSDSIREILKTDSTARSLALDTLRTKWELEQVIPTEFIPVTSLIHTLDIRRLNHSYLSRNTPEGYYANHYYGSWSDVHDDTRALSIRNTLGVALREGFNKWAQMGISLYASHKLRTYTLPELNFEGNPWKKKYTEHDLSVGGVLSRTQGKIIHYNVDGELWVVGENVGDFKVDGVATLDFPISKKDSMNVSLNALVNHQKPGFYFRHYHSQSTWWDNTSMDREFRTRFMGSIGIKRTKTKLTVGVENLKNYTYFAMNNTRKTTARPNSELPSDYLHNVRVEQYNGNIQVFSATLSQDFKFGPVHWENEVTYQKTSEQDILPLPQVSLYTNLYLLFRIAKVLRVQLGGDMRYFTSYYAPDYAPSIGQFAIQDRNHARTKIGNYPIVNVYANLHLKNCRLYASVNHVNKGTGHSFWAPFYPIDPLTIHFGLSWNFFN